MKTITCHCGKEVWLEDDDLEAVSKYPICCTGDVVLISLAFGKSVPLSHFIMGDPCGKIWDHKDRNEHNNLRSNLRLANRFQNQQNRGLNKNNTSGYKGVYFDKYMTKNKWRAQIIGNGLKKRLGCFPTAELAALAYNKAAKELHGEFAVLNEVKV